ncbi:MAG: non-ribosomal peptide synthetase [Candidatus Eremiobacteraeota bacterium]|nr:non-ribosomal peptide synthetase [Candidatus Eremiobacteraeota bacterium]
MDTRISAAARGDGFLARLARAAASDPSGIAVSEPRRSITFAGLDRLSNQLARVLLERGVRAGDSVGVYLDRGVDLVLAAVAILKAGCAFVLTDVTHPRARVLGCLQDAGTTCVIVSARVPLAELGGRAVAIERLGPQVAAAHDGALAELAPDAGAYIVYTSGSTGRPKGVDVPYGAFCNYVSWAAGAYRAAEGSGSILHTSVAFDLALTSIFVPLAAGREVHAIPAHASIADLADAMLRRPGLSLMKLTPLHLRLLPGLLGPEHARGRARFFVVGGEALFRDDLAFWFEHAPDTRIINEYGPSETVVGCVVHEADPRDPRHAVPIGRPISGASIYLLDDELRPVADGARGEIFIGGDVVATGYHRSPELTAQRFVRDPFAGRASARMYRTGDIAYADTDGLLIYAGRADDQIKHRGYRIELGEIESAVRALEHVSDAAVIHVAESGALVAFVVADAPLDEAAVRGALGAVLPEFMVPTLVVQCDALPMTSNGKVDRSMLRARVEN